MKIPASLQIAAAIQFLMLGVAALDAIGYGVPVARQIVGFVFLTFIPGYLLLTILRWRRSITMITILYSVGLSIAFLMFVGVSMNALFPLIGVMKPISTLPLFATLSVITSFLWILSYKISEDGPDSGATNLTGILSLSTMILLLIPCLSVLGMVLVVSYGSNAVLLFLVVLISLVVVLIGTGRVIPVKLYPLAILVISIALLLQYPLVSRNLTGYDVNTEYYYSSLVIQRSYWDSTIPGNINAMASIVMLSPIYSILLSIDNVLVYKIIYPLLFSLVPLGLFYAYRKLSDDRVAFLSAFFFMSFYTFFTEMTGVARQQIAELFFALLILLAFEKDTSPIKRSVLAVVFVASLVLSHYGLSYVFMIFYLVLAFPLLLLLERPAFGRILQYFRRRQQSQAPPLGGDSFNNARIITGTLILLSLVMAFSWYTYVSGSTIIDAIANIGQHIWNSVFTEFFDIKTRGYSVQLVLGGAPATESLLREVNRILQYITQFFIVVGVIVLARSWDKMKGKTGRKDFYIWALTSMVLLVVSVALPFFASSLNMTRIYHIALFLLSLSCVSGGIFFLERLLNLFHFTTKFAIAVLLIILVANFAFNTGFAYEIAGDVPTSASLGFQRLEKSTGNVKVWFASFYIWDEEVTSAQWLSKYRLNTFEVLADVHRRERVLLSYGMIPPEDSWVLSNATEIPSSSYIYLGYLNVVDGLLTYYSTARVLGVFNISDISSGLERCDIVYSDGGSTILISGTYNR